MCYAEAIKRVLRRKAFLEELSSPSRTLEEAQERSRKCWTQYEQVNRDYCPDDPTYSIINASVVGSAADILTCQAPAAGQGRILELLIGGGTTRSENEQFYIWASGTTITGNTAITPEKFNSRAPAAKGTYGKGSTNFLSGNPIIGVSFNNLGGYIRWLAGPGEEVYYINSEVLSCRSVNTSQSRAVSATIVFEEL